jgi:hypothetical protein
MMVRIHRGRSKSVEGKMTPLKLHPILVFSSRDDRYGVEGRSDQRIKIPHRIAKESTRRSTILSSRNVLSTGDLEVRVT